VPCDFQPKFGHAAGEFQRYRPDYPAALYERILAEVPPAQRMRAMDLGAGTGSVTRHLLPYFREAVAVEPDPGMAAKIAEQFPSVILRNVTAEECVEAPESADLVTIANALHWMEAEAVLSNVRVWLRPNAVLAVFDRPFPKTNTAADVVTRAEMRGPWKPYRDRRLDRHRDWPEVVRGAAGFHISAQVKFPNMIPMTPRDYVGFWRSTSYGSAYARTLDEPERYWSDLEARFAAACRGDEIPVDLSPTLILARKI
jgi:SAM-dependent methyltransferase